MTPDREREINLFFERVERHAYDSLYDPKLRGEALNYYNQGRREMKSVQDDSKITGIALRIKRQLTALYRNSDNHDDQLLKELIDHICAIRITSGIKL